MTLKRITTSILAVAILSTTGCAQLGISKQTGGTAIGAGVAGLLCHELGKGNALLTIGCAGAGAFIGNRIGAALDERDQQALAATTQRMLNTAPAAGKAVTWKSQHTAATATVVAGKEFVKPEKVVIKRVATVQPAPADLKLVQSQYITLKSSNVRAAPVANADKVGSLPARTEFTAIGATGDWVLVGRKGVNVGYVHKDLVMPKPLVAKKMVNLDNVDVARNEGTRNMAVTPAEEQAVAQAPVAAAQSTALIEVKPSAKAEAAPSPLQVASSVQSEEVVAQAPCRQVSIAVNAEGKQTKDTSTLCKTSSPEFAAIM